MNGKNYFQCEFSARSQNEALARAVVTAFVLPLDPTVEELSDLRTAVSEAVTNSIIHGYRRVFSPQEDPAEEAEVDGREDIRCGETGGEPGATPAGDMEDGMPLIRLTCRYCGPKTVRISVEDFGCGIEDIALARQPMYTSSPELERSGLGFTIMESFMDSLEVQSEVGKGTKVVMTKAFLPPEKE